MVKKIDLEKVLDGGKAKRPDPWTWAETRSRIICRDKVCKGKDCIGKNNGDAHDVDHIIPVGLGGSSDDDNLQLLCSKCHAKKTKQDVERIRRARLMRSLRK